MSDVTGQLDRNIIEVKDFLNSKSSLTLANKKAMLACDFNKIFTKKVK